MQDLKCRVSINDKDEIKFFRKFENIDKKWLTTVELAKATGFGQKRVLEIINKYQCLVGSSSEKNEDGETTYTLINCSFKNLNCRECIDDKVEKNFFTTFENIDKKWVTATELAEAHGFNKKRVLEIINKYPCIIGSSSGKNQDGETTYTLIECFFKKVNRRECIDDKVEKNFFTTFENINKERVTAGELSKATGFGQKRVLEIINKYPCMIGSSSGKNKDGVTTYTIINRSFQKRFKTKDNNFPVFESELELIKKARNNKDNSKEKIPSTEHELVGLSLSGGGIRSATFNLGFIQALSRQSHLKNVDYLSTVSGGGYIGSSLTTLLNSIENKKFLDRGGRSEKLLDAKHFSFSIEGEDENKRVSEPKSQFHKKKYFKPGKEKKTVRHLRYYSNYLTAAGGIINRYFRPAMVIARGIMLNFLLIIPFILLFGVLFSLFFSIPDKCYNIKNNNYHTYFNLKKFEEALKEQKESQEDLKSYLLKNTIDFPHISYEDQQSILPIVVDQSGDLSKVESTEKTLKEMYSSVWLLPLILLVIMVVINIFFIGPFTQSYDHRFLYSKVLSYFFFFSLALLCVNLFGVALAYWRFFEVPPEIGLISLLSFFAPKLLSSKPNSTVEKKSHWMKVATSIFLFALVPLFLLFLVGSVVNWLIPKFSCYAIVAVAIVIFCISEFWININQISLHNFYRDRLSRAYLFQDGNMGRDPVHSDELKMSDLDERILPYHIINANLNMTKKVPAVDKNKNFIGGEFRNGESFIFSRNWCGSEKTGYRKSSSYEECDDHLNLGTAMAISGAAVNIGMGNIDKPILRLLLGILNIRLGYWAFNPNPKYADKWRLGRKFPGSLIVVKELFGIYSSNRKFINLSDGGHFDNIGVYELLRRRCKYIIVGDAEADPEMRFQALSYIIRMARIDFGIDIDIDVSDIQPQKETGYSRNHCAVGLIKYPAVDGMAEETGYLLYCKSSLTGDEPQHLHEYRTKHPQFPHQTTADQWFDEQQFEAYRELGYQVGKKVFAPVSHLTGRKSLETSFIKLKEFWHPHCPSVEEHFTKHAKELNSIISHVKNDNDLVFMDAQMFPEWDELMEGLPAAHVRELWLPDNAIYIRKGFYVCNLMMQLMENVYLDLNLEKNHQHPDNRGWMNLFRHWSWAGIFRVSWAISACTFGARFQHFCRDKLDLELGDLSVKPLPLKINPECDECIQPYSDEQDKELSTCLNEYERLVLKKLFNKRRVFATLLFSFHLEVKDPLDTSREKRFCFGFVLMNEKKIVYFRIQDHLREMGLGRRALREVVKDLKDQYGLKPKDIKLDEEALKKYENIENSEKLDPYDKELLKTDPEMFEQMLGSVISEI